MKVAQVVCVVGLVMWAAKEASAAVTVTAVVAEVAEATGSEEGRSSPRRPQELAARPTWYHVLQV